MRRPGEIFQNALWIIGCRVFQALMNLVITMFTARYLGPSHFGLIHYAMSITAFVLPLMQLGFNGILVQELVLHPREEGKILGTSMAACSLSALLSMGGILAFAFTVNFGEGETILVCGLYSLTLLAQALEMSRYWFEAHLLSRYASLLSLGAYGIVAGYKLFLLIRGMSVRWFAVANALDFLLIGLGLLVLYRRLGGQKLEFSRAVCRRMMERGKYYILSGLLAAVYAQTDRVMLKLMLGEAATGIYSAAVTCCGLTGFVFMAILDSARPVIFESREKSLKAFDERMICLYALIIYLALGQSLVLTLLAEPVIGLLYGRAYESAAGALRILVWYTTFSYLGAAKNIWLLAENKQNLIPRIDFPGALLNVLLNLLLIPPYGVRGAAAASLITQIFINFFMLLLLGKTRKTAVLMLRALDPGILLRQGRALLSELRKH